MFPSCVLKILGIFLIISAMELIYLKSVEGELRGGIAVNKFSNNNPSNDCIDITRVENWAKINIILNRDVTRGPILKYFPRRLHIFQWLYHIEKG
uniref:Uncharacterized protein n=1 Tax=Lepeophtheirus salmonis TaxID=72036 RepID=A0A0K2UK99_LEPSM